MYMKIHHIQNGKTGTQHKGISPIPDQDHLSLDFVRNHKLVRQMTHQN